MASLPANTKTNTALQFLLALKIPINNMRRREEECRAGDLIGEEKVGPGNSTVEMDHWVGGHGSDR